MTNRKLPKNDKRRRRRKAWIEKVFSRALLEIGAQLNCNENGFHVEALGERIDADSIHGESHARVKT